MGPYEAIFLVLIVNLLIFILEDGVTPGMSSATLILVTWHA
jgi:hypothetical protein